MFPNSSIVLEGGDDSTARLRLAIGDAPGPATWSGSIRGPKCQHTRTLAAEHPVSPDGTILVTEPCYWTPSLPFLYELHAVAEVEGRRLAELQEGVGLRRIETRGGDLFWEGRRVTLRGGKIDDYANVDLAEARALEAGLLVVGPPADFCKQASMCGVPLVVDFRNCGAELSVELVSAARSPAVVAALVDADQVDSTVRFPADAIVAQAVCADGVSRLAPWADVVICEIAPTERPPDWLADCNRPVIAVSKIRDGSLPDARRRCDRLQARLAPEFDLAGYFA